MRAVMGAAFGLAGALPTVQLIVLVVANAAFAGVVFTWRPYADATQQRAEALGWLVRSGSFALSLAFLSSDTPGTSALILVAAYTAMALQIVQLLCFAVIILSRALRALRALRTKLFGGNGRRAAKHATAATVSEDDKMELVAMANPLYGRTRDGPREADV